MTILPYRQAQSAIPSRRSAAPAPASRTARLDARVTRHGEPHTERADVPEQDVLMHHILAVVTHSDE